MDDSRFRAKFGVGATGPDEGAVRTVEWARAQFGPASQDHLLKCKHRLGDRVFRRAPLYLWEKNPC